MNCLPYPVIDRYVRNGPDVHGYQGEDFELIVSDYSIGTLPGAPHVPLVLRGVVTFRHRFWRYGRLNLDTEESSVVIDNNVVRQPLIRQVSPVSKQNEVGADDVLGRFPHLKGAIWRAYKDSAHP